MIGGSSRPQDYYLFSPDSDLSKTVRRIRDVLALKKKRPESPENVVYTVGPSLKRFRKNSHGGQEERTERFDATAGEEACNVEGLVAHGANETSSGTYSTYWIPLSWLKKIVYFLPVYSSSMESRSSSRNDNSE